MSLVSVLSRRLSYLRLGAHTSYNLTASASKQTGPLAVFDCITIRYMATKRGDDSSVSASIGNPSLVILQKMTRWSVVCSNLILFSLASIRLAVEKNPNQFTAWRMGEISAIDQCKWLPNWPNHGRVWNGRTECAWRKNVTEEKGTATIGKRAKYTSRCKFDCLQFAVVVYNWK